MRLKIEIECDTISELISHLTCLQDQVITKAEKEKLDINKDEFTESAGDLDDNNCYGIHEVMIGLDEDHFPMSDNTLPAYPNHNDENFEDIG